MLGFIFADGRKLADEPRDMAVKINTGGKSYCYTPTLANGDGYIYIDYCSASSPQARYDVFERIAYKINDTWLCLSAPSSVTGIEGEATEEWDYVTLRPCALNDKNQRWIIQDNAFFTADKRFKIVHYKWYLAIAKNTSKFYTHKIDSSMQQWINTIATPVNLSLKTIFAWTFVGPGEWGMYYIQNNASYAGTEAIVPLYYNPENGHIAQYYPKTGSLYCMRSNQNEEQSWNWVSWSYCNDNIPIARDASSWEFFLLNDNEGMLKDYRGNLAWVTQYGPNWGVPYTAKIEYEDLTNQPKSNFVFSRDIGDWNRFLYANLGDNLEYCPAPGKKENVRIKRTLPPTFSLTEEWILRFWRTAVTSNPAERAVIGICGTCLLQSYQLIAELQENPFAPPSNSGYFFNIAAGQNPFNSFRERFPILAQRLQDNMRFFDLPFQSGENPLSRYRRALYGMSLTMLPQYQWDIVNYVQSNRDMQNLINSLFRYQRGSLFLYIVVRSNADGTGRTGHAELILRTEDGLVVIPTNAPNHSLDLYRVLLRPITSVDGVMRRLNLEGTRTLYSLGVFQISNFYDNPLDSMISQSNCLGDGEHRRGDRGILRSNLINQCSGGRCALQ